MTPKKPILPYDKSAATSIVGEFLRQVAPLLGTNSTLENFYACEPWDGYATNPDGTTTHIGYWGARYLTNDVASIRDILKLGDDLKSPVWIHDINLSGDSQRWLFTLKLFMVAELEPDPDPETRL